MAKSSRIVSVVIKVAVVALIIKELWLLLGVPSFTDAVMSFLTIGAIPGTDRTLTPDQTYKLLAVVGVLVVVAVFYKDIAKLFWRKTVDEQLPEIPAAPMPLEHPLPNRVVVQPPRYSVNSPIARRGNKYAAIWQSRFSRFGAVTTGVLRVGYMRTVSFVRIVAAKTWIWLKRATRVAYRIVLLLIIIAIELSIAAWRWTEPRIRRFDAWLEKKIRSNDFTSGVLASAQEIITTVKHGYRGVKSIAGDLIKPSDSSKED